MDEGKEGFGNTRGEWLWCRHIGFAEVAPVLSLETCA